MSIVYAFAMLPLYAVLVLTGGDFDGLIEWWKVAKGRRLPR